MDRHPRKKVWVVREGHLVLVSHETKREVLARAAMFTRRYVHQPLAERIELAPDGGPLIKTYPGGTFGGTCGTQLWVDDPDYHLDFLQEPPHNFDVSTQQKWHHNRLVGSPYMARYDDKDLLGFRVACEGRYRHEGACHAGPFRWTCDLTEAQRENIFRRNGQRQERLELV